MYLIIKIINNARMSWDRVAMYVACVRACVRAICSFGLQDIGSVAFFFFNLTATMIIAHMQMCTDVSRINFTRVSSSCFCYGKLVSLRMIMRRRIPTLRRREIIKSYIDY